MAKDDLRSEVTSSRPRDEQGHFIKVPEYNSAKNPLEKFLISHTGNYKDQDDLLDIRIGNPLGKIVNLLEDIKNQKAFSFTLKGSLGIAGVALVLSVFGLFGGQEILCNKGTQSIAGELKVLKSREIYSKQIPVVSYLTEMFIPPKKLIKNRTILMTNEKTYYLPFSENIDFKDFNDEYVIATGILNSCSDQLKIDDPLGLELLN